MMQLKAGDRATFGTRGGRTISGKVFAVLGRHYLVSGDCGIVCNAYSDGMFRFNDHDLISDVDSEINATIAKEAENTALGTFTL